MDDSLARLKLLADAAGRLRARDSLLLSQVVFAAAAGAMHGENQRILARLQDRLERQVSE
jgi:hypothetical protein